MDFLLKFLLENSFRGNNFAKKKILDLIFFKKFRTIFVRIMTFIKSFLIEHICWENISVLKQYSKIAFLIINFYNYFKKPQQKIVIAKPVEIFIVAKSFISLKQFSTKKISSKTFDGKMILSWNTIRKSYFIKKKKAP